MASDDSLFIANDSRGTLESVAMAAFAALGVAETEERFSSNYPPEDHYFVGYASNVVIEVCDLAEVKEGFPIHLSLKPPTYRKGNACAPASAAEVASILYLAGLKVFRPNGNWALADWDGSGQIYAV
jgi:hypothetical protein